MLASGILLAAGASTRFGGSKLLADVGGETMVRRMARVFLEGGLEDLVVVVGARAADVAVALSGLPARLLLNPCWESGMFSSVRAGLLSAPPEARFVAISPADLPGLLREDVARLLSASAAAPERAVVVPRCGVRRGHPVLLPRLVAEDVAGWPPTDRLDRILRNPSVPFAFVDGFGPGVVRDADTPSDLVEAIG